MIGKQATLLGSALMIATCSAVGAPASLASLHDKLLLSHSTSRRELEENHNCTGGPFLWKILHNESRDTVGFGVGTVHLPRDLVTTDSSWGSILNALNDACAVYGELNLNDPSVAREVQACSTDALVGAPTIDDIPDESLRDAFNAALVEIAEGLKRAQLVSAFQGLPILTVQQLIEAYNTLEYRDPFFDAVLQGKDPPILDEDLLDYGRPAGSLETAQTQCDLLAALSPSVEEFQANFDSVWRVSLEQTLSTNYTSMIESYKCGDMESALEMAEMDSPILDELSTILLDERNVGMATEMVRIMEESSTNVPLFAVGLAHWTFGNSSLEVLLEEARYSLERVHEYGPGELPDSTDAMCAANAAVDEETSKEGLTTSAAVTHLLALAAVLAALVALTLV